MEPRWQMQVAHWASRFCAFAQPSVRTFPGPPVVENKVRCPASDQWRACLGFKEIRADIGSDRRLLRLHFPAGQLALHFLKREVDLSDGKTALVNTLAIQRRELL